MKIAATLFFFLVALSLYGQEKITPDAFLLACEKGDSAEVQRLLKLGASPDAPNNQGLTPLTMASAFGRVQVVKDLVAAGANVNLAERNNDATPLMWAAAADLVKRRIKMGMHEPPRPEDKVEITKVLLKAGAELNHKNSWGGTALQWAADSGNVEVVKLLVDAKADVTIGDQTGLTPLIVAANNEGPQFPQIVKILVGAGASVADRDSAGQTPLIASTNSLKPDTAAFLIQSGAEVDARDAEGYTALMRAAQLARAETLQVLLKAGANPNAKNNEGTTVLAVAKKAEFPNIIDLLVKAGAE